MSRSVLLAPAKRGLACICVLLGLSSVGRAMPYDRHVTLVNGSQETIVEFHASNVRTTSWRWDRLGAYVLPPGSSVRLNLDDGTGYCRFDFKTVMADGQVIIRNNVDVCEIEQYTIT
jgi:hypothetical protein